MRLDLFLKASRLCPRRTVAQKICDAGRVTVNGKTAKPSHNVKIGDEIVIKSQTRIRSVRVLEIPGSKQTSRKDSSSLIEVLGDDLIEEDDALIGIH